MLVSVCSASRIAYVVGCPYAGRWRAEWPSVRRVRQADTRNILNSLGGGANVSAEQTYSRRLFVAYQELVEGSGRDLDGGGERRSEEATPELQSLMRISSTVFC